MSFIEIIQLYGITVLVFITCYLSGHFFLSLFVKQQNKFWIKLLTGITLLTTFYALFKTGGKTIMLTNVLLGLVLLFYYKKNQLHNNQLLKNRKSIFSKELIPTLIALSLFFFIQLNLLVDVYGGFKPIALDRDYSYYARISSYIRDFGIENRSMEYFLSDKGGNTVYHYFELWFSTLVSKIFGISTQLALNLVVFTILFTCIYSCIIELIRQVKIGFKQRANNYDYWIAFSFFIISMAEIIYPNYIAFLKMDIWVATPLSMSKLTPIYLFLIPFLILFFNKKYFVANICAGFIAVAYTPTAPALFFGLGLYYSYKWLIKKDFTTFTFVKNISPLIFCSAVIATIYFLFSGEADSVSISSKDILNHYKDTSALKTVVNIFGKTSIQIIITCLPFLLLAFVLRKRINKAVLLMVILITISGLLFYAMLHQMHDAIQLWSNLYIPLINVAGFCVILLIIYSKKIKHPVFGFIIVFIFTSSFYLKNPFYNKTKNYLTKFKTNINNPKFGYLKQASDYDYFSSFEQVYIGQTHSLMRQYDPLYITCLSNHNIPIYNDRIKRFQKNTTFLKYAEQLKRNGNFMSYEDTQIKFINEYKIDYLLVFNKRELPSNFKQAFNENAIGEIDNYLIYERTKPSF